MLESVLDFYYSKSEQSRKERAGFKRGIYKGHNSEETDIFLIQRSEASVISSAESYLTYVFFKIYKPCIPGVPTLLLQGEKVERTNHMGEVERRKCKIRFK